METGGETRVVKRRRRRTDAAWTRSDGASRRKFRASTVVFVPHRRSRLEDACLSMDGSRGKEHTRRSRRRTAGCTSRTVRFYGIARGPSSSPSTRAVRLVVSCSVTWSSTPFERIPCVRCTRGSFECLRLCACLCIGVHFLNHRARTPRPNLDGQADPTGAQCDRRTRTRTGTDPWDSNARR